MSAVTNTFESVKEIVLSAHANSTTRGKLNFYNSWAQSYVQDIGVLEYRAPHLAANSISSHFKADREAAVVLDIACGTGLVAQELSGLGFKHFVGVDGSEGMLELARSCGLYQELKQSILGEEPIAAQSGYFDVVVIVGALCVGAVPVQVVRELCNCAKSGGYVCMTTRRNCDNMEYKAALDDELKQMEREGLWTCVEITEVEDWERAVSEKEHGYIPGVVYLYQKL